MTVANEAVIRAALEGGPVDDALSAARMAVELDRENGEAHALVAEALLRLERWEEGLAAAHEAARFSPESSDAYRLQCVALENLGRFEEEIVAAEKAVHVAPLDANAHYFLGRALWESGRVADAQAPFERAVELEPLVPLYRRRLASQIFDADAPRAEMLLRQVVRETPSDPHALHELAVLLERRGRAREASRLYARAWALAPDFVIARDNLFRLRRAMNVKLAFVMAVLVFFGLLTGIPAFCAHLCTRRGHPTLAAVGWTFAVLGGVALAAVRKSESQRIAKQAVAAARSI